MSGINGTHVFTIRRMKCLVEKMQDESNDIGYVVTLDSDMDALNDIQAWLEKAARTNTIPACDGKHDGGPCRDRECYVKPEAVAVHQWREIGETEWMDCNEERKIYCDQSPEHDSRTLYTTPPQPQAAAVPDGEWKKRIQKWIDFLDGLKSESIPKFKKRQAESIVKQVTRYRDHGKFNDYSAQPQTPQEKTLDSDERRVLRDALLKSSTAITQTPGDGWVKCSERLPEPRFNSRKQPNGILVKFDTGRITQIHDVTETLVARMKNGPRQPAKFESPVIPRIVAWMDLDSTQPPQEG